MRCWFRGLIVCALYGSPAAGLAWESLDQTDERHRVRITELAAAWGEAVPIASGSDPLRSDALLTVTPTELSMDGVPLGIAIKDGVLAEGARRGMLITDLYDHLSRRADARKTVGDILDGRGEFEGRVVLVVHGEVTYGAVSQVLYTAGQAQFGRPTFVVRAETGVGGVRVYMPVVCVVDCGGDEDTPRANLLVAAHTAGGFDVSSRDDEATAAALPALADIMDVQKALWPDERTVTLTPEPEMPFRTVISAIEVLRGEAGERFPGVVLGVTP